ncbi:hypothetical protein OFO01_06930 [Campylobacter sp. JMF_01 NE2]|uniref:hypothetical protein n=1 Tax=unclassified Campylobacter TaxID=2593542 RepID=UPI0022E9DAA8|nr:MULTISPECIES: hypothetical protein [unclassified Campylobacter]MDA3053304.1 hypothetical protein [Campylobacter sp. JMF_03 NE3]MDA3067513.1 hypothetical protein [Campylobacter sp. JMF_01 NE2]
MRLILCFCLFLANVCFAKCYGPCVDSASDLGANELFMNAVMPSLQKINSKVEFAKQQLDTINQLNADKLRSYVALKNLKVQELLEHKKINFTLQRLIDEENIRIRALDIRAKRKLNEE